MLSRLLKSIGLGMDCRRLTTTTLTVRAMHHARSLSRRSTFVEDHHHSLALREGLAVPKTLFLVRRFSCITTSKHINRLSKRSRVIGKAIRNKNLRVWIVVKRCNIAGTVVLGRLVIVVAQGGNAGILLLVRR